MLSQLLLPVYIYQKLENWATKQQICNHVLAGVGRKEAISILREQDLEQVGLWIQLKFRTQTLKLIIFIIWEEQRIYL